MTVTTIKEGYDEYLRRGQYKILERIINNMVRKVGIRPDIIDDVIKDAQQTAHLEIHKYAIRHATEELIFTFLNWAWVHAMSAVNKLIDKELEHSGRIDIKSVFKNKANFYLSNDEIIQVLQKRVHDFLPEMTDAKVKAWINDEAILCLPYNKKTRILKECIKTLSPEMINIEFNLWLTDTTKKSIKRKPMRDYPTISDDDDVDYDPLEVEGDLPLNEEDPDASTLRDILKKNYIPSCIQQVGTNNPAQIKKLYEETLNRYLDESDCMPQSKIAEELDISPAKLSSIFSRIQTCIKLKLIEAEYVPKVDVSLYFDKAATIVAELAGNTPQFGQFIQSVDFQKSICRARFLDINDLELHEVTARYHQYKSIKKIKTWLSIVSHGEELLAQKTINELLIHQTLLDHINRIDEQS